MTQAERVAAMERRLDAAWEALRALERALDGFDAARENIDALESYLTSRAWREDFESDEQGLLPASLKRGVLSEDGISTLLDTERELRERMKQI